MANLQEIQKAVEQGDPNLLNTLLESYLLQGDPDEQYGLSEWLAEIGFVEEAIKVLEHLQYIFPEEAQLIIDRANLLIDADREDDALNALMEVPKDDELYAQALVTLADLFQLQGLLEAAENRLNEAIELMPDEPLLQQAKAELLLDSGRYLESAKIYQELEAQRVVIEGVNISERLAEVYSAGAAYEEALPYYEKALEDSATPDVLFGAAFAAFQTRQYEGAVRRLDELIGTDPDYFSAYLLKAQSLNMSEDYEAAYRAISEGIARDEFDKELYLFAGKLAMKLGKAGEGVGHLRQAIALDPEYMEAIYTLVSYFHTQEQDAEVLELADMVIESGDDWAGLYPMIAEAYERSENYEQATAYYDKAYSSFKEDSAFLKKYALFLIEEGKRAAALEIIKELQALEPENPEWFDWQQSFE
ncbi:tetratricopeptide (TPR) repeat protein [Planomicrobium stackebrandtii]|uniref:Tetratricopeptide (TPR) repeat protein n=1 Tax=Planomicrobium stackebrandtii TaxID=253160 RepID=A0ABU0GQM6_9BACL|nr:tetratricopeptide repeat protein [Planomicrobium stackebrandtii]MDQ0427588.1 tetratricopeptide (TPR) repeat protein [Planomicrobium stackebrandtii]